MAIARKTRIGNNDSKQIKGVETGFDFDLIIQDSMIYAVIGWGLHTNFSKSEKLIVGGNDTENCKSTAFSMGSIM